MSEGRWFDAWVPWPELSGLAAAGRALLPSVPATPAALARTVTEQLVGRRLTTTVQGHEVGLTLTKLDYPADSLRLATGRVGDVRLVAENIDWPVPGTPADPAGSSADSLGGTDDVPRTAEAGATSNGRGETTARTTAGTSGAAAGNDSRFPLGTPRPARDSSGIVQPAHGHSASPGGDHAGDRRVGKRADAAAPDSAQQEHSQPLGEDAYAKKRRVPGTSNAQPRRVAQPTSRRAPQRPAAGREADSTSLRTTGKSGQQAVARIPLRRVTVLAREVRLRGLPSPAVIPASVELDVEVSGAVVRDRVSAARPDLIATPHAEGFRVRWRKHPSWGYLTLVADIEDSAVVLTPSELHIGRWKRRPPKRVQPIVLPLPDLPKGLRLTGIRPAEDELALTIAADEWPGKLARIPLPDLLSWLTTAAMTLTLPGFGTRSLP